MPNTIHQGRNVRRFREMLGIKQEALATTLGSDWNQQKVSLLEQKETLEASLLQQVSAALKIPVEAIRSFDEEKAVNIISNTFHDQSTGGGVSYNGTININPVERWLEALEEIKRLNEALLREKDERLRLMERFLEK